MTAMTDAAAETPIKRRPRSGGTGLGRFYAEHQRLILGVAGILMVLVPWELVVRFGLVKEILISSPTAVAESFVTEFARGDIWRHIWASGRVWLVGYGLASVLGILLGLAAGWYRRAGLITVPWLNFVYAAPDLAFVPIFILWFGLGFTFKVWVVFLGVIIYVSLNTIAGVQATENRYLAVARTYGASRLMVFRSIVLPGSIPYIMTGLRIASGRAIVGVVGAEFISSNEGLGFLISISGTTLQTSRVFVGIILLAAFGVILNEILGRIERRFEAWRREVHA
ncbi:MAG TPA: ABC transporter permease [Candidatus Limnocylindrales bacterium]|nr:ABC transporter permease [Candidatus Limnocylindrales bacterium]